MLDAVISFVYKLVVFPFAVLWWLVKLPFRMLGFFKPKTETDVDACPRFADIPEVAETDKIDAAWPPAPHPVEALSVQDLIRANGKLIRNLCYATTLSEEESQRYLLPVITNLAKIVHLTPASEYDHHQGYGGLFTHTLEVAYYAANDAKTTIFDRSANPKDLHNNKRRWILTAVLAALTHDIGKPFTDMEITAPNGLHWVRDEPLVDWLRKNRIENYYISFRPGREHNQHKSAALANSSMLIPKETLSFLGATGYGEQMLKEFRSAILEGRAGGLIGRILDNADGLSRNVDGLRQRQIRPEFKNVAHPQGDQLLKAIRVLIQSARWTTNKDAKSRIFITKQGCYIVWSEEVATEARAQALDMGYESLPADFLRLGMILVEAGAAVRNSDEVSNTHNIFWRMTPIVLGNVQFDCIRLADPQLVFDATPPAAIEALVEGLPIDDVTKAAWVKQWKFLPVQRLSRQEEEEMGYSEEYISTLIEASEESNREADEIAYLAAVEMGTIDAKPVSGEATLAADSSRRPSQTQPQTEADVYGAIFPTTDDEAQPALKLNDEIGDSDEASATVVAKADETAKVAVNDQHRDEAADSIPGTEGGELAVDVALCDESLPGATETDEISLQPSQATPSRAVVAMNADELPDLDDSRATAAEIPGNARELLTQPIDPDTIDEGFLTDTGEIVEDEELPELDDVAESKKEPAFKQSFWQAQTPEDEMRTELAVNAQRNDLENELLSEKLLPRAMTEKKKPKHDSKPQTDESSFNMAALFGTTETKKAKKAKKKAADTPKNVPGKNDAAHNEEAKRADATDKVKAQTPKANATVKAKEVKPQSGNLAPGTSDSADSVAARPEFALVPDTFVDLPVVPEAPPRVFFNEPLTAKSATVQEKVANEDAKPEETAKPGQVTAVDEPIEVVEPDIYAQKPSAGNLKTTASAKVKKPKRGATQTKPQTSEQQIKRAREMVESMESQLVSGFGIWIKDGITTDPYTGCMSTNSYSFEQAVNDAGLDPDTVELCFEDRKLVVPHVAWNRDTRKLLLIEVL